jgi:V/A-type H+/Na+-transporting ATPase subunit I
MLKAKPMCRLFIAASKDQLEPVISELYRHNLFHIDEFVDQTKEGYEGFRIGMPLAEANAASSDLLKIRSVESTYLVTAGETGPETKQKSADIRALIERDLPIIEKEAEEMTGRKSMLENEEKELEQKIELLRPFVQVPVDMDLLRGYQSLSVYAGFTDRDVEPDIPHERYYSPSKTGNFIVLIVEAGQRSVAERALSDAMFQMAQIPEENGSAASAIGRYEARIGEIKTELNGITAKMEECRKNHADFLLACDELLTTDVEKAEAPLRFATTEQAFVAEGFVPADEIEGLIEAINTATGGKSYVIELPVDREHDIVPVEYNNPSFCNPTELIIDTYARPNYTEIDPTLVVAFIFPIFFGLMLGDVGYGLILLALSLVLRRVFVSGDGARLVKTLMIFSFSTIIFGLLYSEIIGFKLFWEPLIFSRHMNIGGEGGPGAAIPQLLVTSIWIGVLYITLGRVFGIINHMRNDHGSHRTKMVLGNLGWILVMWGILIAIWAYFTIPLMIDLTRQVPVVAGFTPGAIGGILMIVVGVIFIAQENMLDVFEVPTIISHTLSFTRLVAVGLSSVAIAMVVNYISIGLIIGPQLKNITAVGVIIIILGVLIFIVGHVGNAALGLIDGALQSLRLNYVEFFTKFYKGGGKKYNPFGMKRKFTED